MGSKKTPPPDPAQQELARAQVSNMQEQSAMSKEQYAWMKQMAESQQTRGDEQFAFQRGLAETSQANAVQDRQFFYDTTGQQVRAFNDEVNNYNAAGMGDQMAGRAMTDIEGQLAAGRANFGRAMSVRGLNAGSPAAMAMMMDQELDGSLAKAGAATMARDAARREGLQLRSAAAGLGSAFGGMSMSGMGQASGMGMQSLGAGSAGLSAAGAAGSSFNQGMAGAAGWGAGANSTFNSVAQQNAARSQSSGGLGSALGSIAGAAIGSFAGPMGSQLGASLGKSLFGPPPPPPPPPG